MGAMRTSAAAHSLKPRRRTANAVTGIRTAARSRIPRSFGASLMRLRILRTPLLQKALGKQLFHQLVHVFSKLGGFHVVFGQKGLVGGGQGVRRGQRLPDG